MSAALQLGSMSLAEFLEWDEKQEGRFEYDGHGPVAMVGGTVAHDIISGNIYALLWQSLRGRPCRPYTGNMRIEVAGRIRTPDVMVSCVTMEPTATKGADPVVVFEVLSPSTALTDTTTKNAEYRDTQSIRRYVMLDQDRIGGMMFVRRADDWTGSLLTGADTALDMPEIGVSLRLGDIHEGVGLPPA